MSIIWSGEGKSLVNLASGGKLVTERYKLTAEYIYVETGVLGSKGEQIPLWAVRDLDTLQTLVQKARGIGDLVIHCEHNDYTGKASFSISNIEDFRSLRDKVAELAQTARLEYQKLQQTQHVNYSGAPLGAPPVPRQANVAPLDSDPLAKLEKLGDLMSKGLITQEEFDVQKKRLLGME